MKISITILLLITFVVLGHGQDSKKIFAENIQSSEKVIKGAPFSAEAINESVQLFADGNRIIRRSTSRLYRDSEGRFRREDMPRQLGVPGATIEMPESILILDPVVGYKYVLNQQKNTARQSTIKNSARAEEKFRQDSERKIKEFEREVKEVERELKAVERQSKLAQRQEKINAKAFEKEVEKEAETAVKENADKLSGTHEDEAEKRLKSNSKTESLGTQNIEGVEADGTRTTTTIPAGSIGNEREINVVYEKWYSKDLQMIVLSKRNDPGFGEQTYRLTNINRGEQPASLFSTPSGYTILPEGRASPKPVAGPAAKVPRLGKKPLPASMPVPPKKPD